MEFLARKKTSFRSGVQYAWDATSLDLAMRCERKYYYKMILGIQPKELSVHLLFGALYATALEHFYKYRAEGQDIQSATRAVVREALISSWTYETTPTVEGDPGYPEGVNIIRGTGHPTLFNDAAKTRVNLIRTIVWYIEQFAIETDDGLKTYHLANGKPACELSFSLDFTPDILYCGHLDRVVSMDDKLYIMDQKTTSGTVGTYYFNNFSPSNQMTGYALAGQAVLHSPISGVIIDAAQIAVNFTRFERGITSRSKDQIEEWHTGVIQFITQFQDMMTYAGEIEARWPMRPVSCGVYGGCDFRLLCQKSPKVRDNYIKTDFIQHNWDPLERR